MDPRDGSREGKVTEFKVETSYYLLASVTEFQWKRKLYPKSGSLRLGSWQSRALSGSGPVRVPSGTLTCEGVSEAGLGRGRSHHDGGIAQASTQCEGSADPLRCSGAAHEHHATGRAGAQPLQSQPSSHWPLSPRRQAGTSS